MMKSCMPRDPIYVEISALAGMELGMARMASALTTATEAPRRKQLCRPGKGKISRGGYFFLLTSSFYQCNWLSSPLS